MKKRLLLFMVLYPFLALGAFNYETITTNFSVNNLSYDYQNFSWDISGYSDVKFDVDFDQTFSAIALRFAYPRKGTIFLDVTNGVIAGTNLTFTIARTNLPPKGPYYVEFVGYETDLSNSPTRIIALGKVNIHYSVYQNTTQSSWTNPLAGTVIGPPIHTLSTPLSGWPFVTTIDFINYTNNVITEEDASDTNAVLTAWPLLDIDYTDDVDTNIFMIHTNDPSAHHVKFANSDETDPIFTTWSNNPVFYQTVDFSNNVVSNADLSLYAGNNVNWSNNQFNALAGSGYTDAEATNAVLIAWPLLDTDYTDDVGTNTFTNHINNASAHHVKFTNTDEIDPTLTNRTNDIVFTAQADIRTDVASGFFYVTGGSNVDYTGGSGIRVAGWAGIHDNELKLYAGQGTDASIVLENSGTNTMVLTYNNRVEVNDIIQPMASNTGSAGTALKPFNSAYVSTGHFDKIWIGTNFIDFANSDETDPIFTTWSNNPVFYQTVDFSNNVVSNADLSLYAGNNVNWSNNQFNALAGSGYTDAEATNAVLIAWPLLDTDYTDDVGTNEWALHTNDVSAHHVKFTNSDEIDPTLTNRTNDIVFTAQADIRTDVASGFFYVMGGSNVDYTGGSGIRVAGWAGIHNNELKLYAGRSTNASIVLENSGTNTMVLTYNNRVEVNDIIQPMASNTGSAGTALKPFNSAYVNTGHFDKIWIGTNFIDGVSTQTLVLTDTDVTNAVMVAFPNLATNAQMIFTNSINISVTNSIGWFYKKVPTEFNSIDVIRGRIYVSTTNNNPYDQTITINYSTTGAGNRGGDGIYEADVRLSQVLLTNNISITATNLYVQDSSVFQTNDLIWIQGLTNEFGRIANIDATQNKLSVWNGFQYAHLASNAVSRVAEYGGFSLWYKNIANGQNLWIRTKTTQTVDLVNWIEYKE